MAAFTAAMNAFLSNVPGCWASMVSALAAFAWPVRSSVGARAASWASLAFAAAGGCARLTLAKVLTFFVTWVNAGSLSGSTPGGLTGGCSSCSPESAAGSAAGPPPTAGAGAGGAAPGPPPAGFAPFAAALPRGLLAGTGLGGGTGFLGATCPGPKPVVVTASAEAGGRTPSRSTGTPRFFAAFSPFSSTSTSGSSFFSSSARRRSRTAPGRPAPSAARPSRR